MSDVFISYSKERAAEAKQLVDELSDLGYDVWWDTVLTPTGSYSEEITRQLKLAKAAIVIWSPESVSSQWVCSEAADAARQKKLINTHVVGLDTLNAIPKPHDQTHSVLVNDVKSIFRALEALKVPRSFREQPKTGPDPEAEADDRLFAEIERKGTADAYQYYLDNSPNGRHARVVGFRLVELRGKIQPPVIVVSEDCPDPIKFVAGRKKGERIICQVTVVQDNGIEIRVPNSSIKGFMKSSELARDRAHQRPFRFHVGQQIVASFISIDASGRITVSIKRLEPRDESGQTLAQILGSALVSRPD